MMNFYDTNLDIFSKSLKKIEFEFFLFPYLVFLNVNVIFKVILF